MVPIAPSPNVTAEVVCQILSARYPDSRPLAGWSWLATARVELAKE